MIRFDILTLFPEIVKAPLGESLLNKAAEKGLVQFGIHDIRSFTHDKHRITDDVSYGGGPGMVMKPEPIFEAVHAVQKSAEQSSAAKIRVILMTPAGKRFSQEMAKELSRETHLIFICGRYEGVDERVREHLVTNEISIGDYVLTGGEVPALVVIDAVARLIPGVVGDPDSLTQESFESGLLDWPHYTKPEDFEGCAVPAVLRSGNHKEIAAWRRRQAVARTARRRPDLLAKADLTDEDRATIESALKGEMQ